MLKVEFSALQISIGQNLSDGLIFLRNAFRNWYWLLTDL